MLNICGKFQTKGAALSCEPYGNGHINVTYLVKTDEEQYILQRINHHIFQDVPGLMRNVERVTAFLAEKDPDPRHSLHLVPAKDGAAYVEAEGEFYRMYDFVHDSICLDAPETDEDFYQSAVAFGSFQRQLADFPANELSETIPRFHDTPNRYRALRAGLPLKAKIIWLVRRTLHGLGGVEQVP